MSAICSECEKEIPEDEIGYILDDSTVLCSKCMKFYLRLWEDAYNEHFE